MRIHKSQQNFVDIGVADGYVERLVESWQNRVALGRYRCIASFPTISLNLDTQSQNESSVTQ
jgi:hypothetical protein